MQRNGASPDESPLKSSPTDLWKEQFRTDRHRAMGELRQLSKENHEGFLVLCRELARDTDEAIRANALKMLGYYGSEDDLESEEVSLAALRSGSATLKDPALLALGKVGTPQTFPLLLSYAVADSSVALEASAKQARTFEQQQEVIQVARAQIFSSSTRMIYTALSILRRFSTPQREADLLLEVLREHPSDIILHTLRHADPNILPVLEEMQATFREGTVQYLEITDTIAHLRNKQMTI